MRLHHKTCIVIVIVFLMATFVKADVTISLSKVGDHVLITWTPEPPYDDLLFALKPNHSFFPLVINAAPPVYHYGAVTNGTSFYYLVGNYPSRLPALTGFAPVLITKRASERPEDNLSTATGIVTTTPSNLTPARLER